MMKIITRSSTAAKDVAGYELWVAGSNLLSRNSQRATRNLLLILLLGPGHDPVDEPDDQNGRDQVINGFRLLVFERGDHGFPDHGDQSHPDENADMEFAALEVGYLGVHQFDHEPQEQHGPERRNNAPLHVAGDEVHHVLYEEPHDAGGEADESQHQHEVGRLRKSL